MENFNQTITTLINWAKASPDRTWYISQNFLDQASITISIGNMYKRLVHHLSEQEVAANDINLVALEVTNMINELDNY